MQNLTFFERVFFFFFIVESTIFCTTNAYIVVHSLKNFRLASQGFSVRLRPLRHTSFSTHSITAVRSTVGFCRYNHVRPVIFIPNCQRYPYDKTVPECVTLGFSGVFLSVGNYRYNFFFAFFYGAIVKFPSPVYRYHRNNYSDIIRKRFALNPADVDRRTRILLYPARNVNTLLYSRAYAGGPN